MRHVIKAFFLSLFFIKALFCYSHTENKGAPLFIENKNQWKNQVLFKADIPGGALFLEKTGFTYNFYDQDAMSRLLGHNFESGEKIRRPDKVKFHGLKVSFNGAGQNPGIKKQGRSEGYNNYFLGNDKSSWASFAYGYNHITYEELYPLIDLSIYTTESRLKYDFIVKPGGNHETISLSYQGADKIYLEKGNLYIKTSVNEIIEQKPYAYQIIGGKQLEVPCRFVLNDTAITFEILKGYDKTKELVIDPVLIFSRSSGSTADNFGMTATYDAEGNFYAGGTAFNNGYPVTTGAYDVTFSGPPANGLTDVVITKYSPDGSGRIYSTYLGGSGTETVHSLIVNDQNELYLYGVTGSANFPITTGAYDNSFAGGTSIYFPRNGTNFNTGTDIYIAKFNVAGTSLVGSTYIGGSMNDGINMNQDGLEDSLQYNYGDQFRGEIMIDKNSNCYIASSTRSANFPIVNGFQDTLNGDQDGVVCKFSPDLTTLTWSTYIGGSEKDASYAIKVDTAEIVYITGGTISADFPIKDSTLNGTYLGGLADGYIAIISKNGDTLLRSTFIGSPDYDQSYFLELDRHQNIYLFGQSLGPYPIKPAIGIYNNPNSGQFITKINNALDSVFYSTIFGNGDGTTNISPAAFLIDQCENIYISGWGANILQASPLTGMPIKNALASPPQPTDGFNFYLAAFARDADSLIFGSYFGGNQSQEHVDGGTSRFDKKGIVYQSVCAGCGGNQDFPNTVPGAPLNQSNNCNNGVFKLDFEIAPRVSFEPSVYSGCAPLTVTFNNFSKNIIDYKWDFGNGDTTSNVFEPTRIFNDTGTFIIKLIITDSICNVKDTALQTITVFQPVSLQPIVDTVICDTATVFMTAFTNATANTFIWSSNPAFTDTLNSLLTDSTYSTLITAPVTWYVKAFNANCAVTESVFINFKDINTTLSDSILCGGDTLFISVTNTDGSDTLSYAWQSSSTIITGLNSNSILVNPDTTTTYFVTVSNGYGCTITDSSTIEVSEPITFSSLNDLLLCDTATVTLTAANGGGADSFIWSTNNNFSDTLNSPLTDSLTIFVDNPVTYYIKGINEACSTEDSVFINFQDINIITNDTSICLNDTIPVSVINTDISDTLSYSWQFSPSILSGTGTQQINVNPLIHTTYYVTVSNNYGCAKTDSLTVTVSNIPLYLSSNNDSILCNPDSVTLFASTDGIANSYVWSSDSLFSDTIITAPDSVLNAFVSSDTTFFVIASIPFCYRKDSVTILLRNLRVEGENVFICKGTQGKITAGTNYPEETLTWEWQPEDSVISGQGTSGIIASPLTNTTFNVKVTDQYGCKDSAEIIASVSVLTPDMVVASADKDSIFKNSEVTLHALPAQGYVYSWQPFESLNNSAVANPVASPSATTNYILTVTENDTCSYSDTVTIYVYEINCKEPDVFIPNAFTPNDDNQNDKLFVRGKHITDMHLSVFNRWGEKVFETTDQSVGWDGFYNGMKADPGVFVYHLTIKCLGGQEYFKKGNVTLIR